MNNLHLTPKHWIAGLALLAVMTCSTHAGEAGSGEHLRFVQELLARDRDRFKTAELAETEIRKQEQSPFVAVRQEALLARAALCRWQAEKAPEAQRAELLACARQCYADFEAQSKDHPLLPFCRGEAAGMRRDTARALLAAAGLDPASAKRKQAAEMLAQLADEWKAVAERLRPAVAKAFAQIDTWTQAHPEAQQLPGALLDAARKALDAYIPADRQFVLACMEQLAAHAAGEPAQKALVAEIAAYCKAQADSDLFMQPGLEAAGMWYGFLKGRVHALAGEDQLAETAWQEALGTVDAVEDPVAVREAREIKLLIGRDFMKLLLRQAERHPERLALAAQVAGQLERDYPDLTKLDAGKEIAIDGALARSRVAAADAESFEQAVGMLGRVIRHGGPWASNACRALASVLAESRRANVTLKLTAQVWFDAAHGFFLSGQLAWREALDREAAGAQPAATERRAQAREQFVQAVEAYREVIKLTRAQAAQYPLMRLQLEPRAWFEAGLCHFKLDDLAAALLAFQALDENFAPATRVKWLPDAAKQRAWYLKPEVKAALERLDKSDPANADGNGLLLAAERNLSAAFNRYRAQRPGEVPPVTPKGWQEEEALAGKRVLAEAQALRSAGLQALQRAQAVEGVRKCRVALAKFRESAGLFEQVPVGDRNHEAALYQAPVAWQQALGLLIDKAFAAQLPLHEREALLQEAGAKALAGFAVYEAHVAKSAGATPETAARRERLVSAVHLARAMVHFYLHAWKPAIESCDACIEREKVHPPQAGGAKHSNACFLKFQALSHLAAEAAAPESDVLLNAAMALLPELKAHENWHGYALRNLIARYTNAVLRGKDAGEAAPVAAARHARLAELYKLAGAAQAEPGLDDSLRLVHHLREAGQLPAAAEFAERLLRQFDPDKKNARLEDALWPAVYEKMTRAIRYDDLNKWGRCKRDHLALLDLLYDTPEGTNRGQPGARQVAHDQLALDYARALEQAASIRANYPDCATHRPRPGAEEQLLNGASLLQAVEEEIEFRRRMISTRDMLAELALEVAGTLEASGDVAGARRFRALAAEQMEVLLETWYGQSPEMRIRIAQVKLANKEWDAALDLLLAVKRDEPETSSGRSFRVSRLISEACFAAGRYEEAAEFPRRMLVLEVGDNWMRKHWPGMRAFAEACYGKGALRPAPVAAVAEKMDYEMQTPDEKEFAELQRVYEQARRSKDLEATLLTRDFLERHEFLKRKIEHYRSFAALERRALEAGAAAPAKALSAAFKARHEAARQLVAAESEAWRAEKALDEAIVKFGGVERVPREYNDRRRAGFEKVAALRVAFKALPVAEN